MPHASQVDRTIQETVSSLSPTEIIAEAKIFFSRRLNVYSAFLDQESDVHVTFRGQGGEELVIGVAAGEDGTRVTGSSYLFDQQIARFFSLLPGGAGNAK